MSSDPNPTSPQGPGGEAGRRPEDGPGTAPGAPGPGETPAYGTPEDPAPPAYGTPEHPPVPGAPGGTGPAGEGPWPQAPMGGAGSGPAGGPEAGGPGGSGGGGRPGAEFFGRIRGFGIVRPDSGRWAAGVCAGIAQRLGVDPLLVRGLFIALALIGGVGIGLYGLAWLFLPHPDGRIHAEGVLHGVVTAGFVGSVLCILFDLHWFDTGHDRWFWPWTFGAPPWGAPGPLLATALIALFVWWLVTRGRPGGPGSPQPPTPPGSTPGTTARAGEPPQYGADARRQAPSPSPVPGAGPASAPGHVAAPVAPPRPDWRRPIRTLNLATLGLALLAATSVLLWDRTGSPVPGHVAVVAMAVGLGVVALGVITSGLLGRRSGGLAAIAVLLAIITVNSAVAAGTRFDVGQHVWHPTSAVAVADGYDLGAGDAVLDLTSPALVAGRTPDDPLRVRAHVRVGQLRLILPHGVSAEVQASVNAGNITDAINTGDSTTSGNVAGTSVRTTVRTDTERPVLIVEARIGLGNLEVTR